MTEKRIPSEKTEPEEIIIRGRVQVKESRQPVPDLLVQVFWVNPTELKGANRSWYRYVERDDVVRFAGEEITGASGAFSLSLYMKDVLGDRPVIGLVVFDPDVEAPEKAQPIYVSPVPSALANRRSFLLAIPAKRLEEAGALPPEPPTATEILNRAEDRDKEISDWLRADQTRRDDSIREIVSQSRRAFKNFRPSTVPKSVREHDNYLEDRGKLTETLTKVRAKSLQHLEDPKNVKPRRVILSKEKAAELGLDDANKTIKISLKELTRILDSEQHSGETSIHSTLLATKLRREREQRVVEALYEHFTLMNEEEE